MAVEATGSISTTRRYTYESSIYRFASTATVRPWNLPALGAKEDSHPAVYQITGGHKRHITSPAELFALGYTWADVESVPTERSTYSPTGAPLSVPSEVTVPDVVEWPRAAAVQEITTAGLVAHLSGPTSANAWVHDQSPASGTLVNYGSVVTLHMRTGRIP